MSLGSPEPLNVRDKQQSKKKLLGGPHWVLWFFYSVATMNAVYGEFGTRFSNATFGFYYIVIGMTVWAALWLALLILNALEALPHNLLAGSAAVGGLAVLGYIAINP